MAFKTSHPLLWVWRATASHKPNNPLKSSYYKSSHYPSALENILSLKQSPNPAQDDIVSRLHQTVCRQDPPASMDDWLGLEFDGVSVKIRHSATRFLHQQTPGRVILAELTDKAMVSTDLPKFFLDTRGFGGDGDRRWLDRGQRGHTCTDYPFEWCSSGSSRYWRAERRKTRD